MVVVPLGMGIFKGWLGRRRTEKTPEATEDSEDVKHLSSQLKTLENELRNARSYVDKCKQSKEDFLSVMSHEIRTPLTAIAGMTHLMNSAKSLEEAKMHGQTMEKSVQSLIGLIEDVLDYNLIQTGKLQLESVDFDLHQSLERLISNHTKRAEQKGLNLKLFLDPFLPFWVRGDEERLLQVLENLLSNSLRFTHSGSVLLSAEYIKSGNNFEGNIKFSVTDSGIGIDEHEVIRIFDRLAEPDLTPDRNYGGKGLGLTISKALVDLMGGQLEVESVKGKGSKFFFTIALEKAEISNFSNDVIEDPDIPDDLSVLVVDDNEMNRVMLSQFLLKWKVQCEVAEDGEDALRKIMKKSYDIILLDLQMPKMDGYELTKLIRNTPTTMSIPIIGISADSVSNVHEGVTNAGMNDFITKPFNPIDLKRKVSKFSQNLQKHE